MAQERLDAVYACYTCVHRLLYMCEFAACYVQMLAKGACREQLRVRRHSTSAISANRCCVCVLHMRAAHAVYVQICCVLYMCGCWQRMRTQNTVRICESVIGANMCVHRMLYMCKYAACCICANAS